MGSLNLYCETNLAGVYFPWIVAIVVRLAASPWSFVTALKTFEFASALGSFSTGFVEVSALSATEILGS